jgi:hypothetical protein
MWIKNKRTNEYKCVSPAIGKHTIHFHPNVWKDTQEKSCPNCGTGNHREKLNCRNCGASL